MMKICHVAINNIFLPAYEGGGVHEFEIAKNLSILGNEVCMFIDKKNGKDRKNETMEGIRIRRLNLYRIKRKFVKSGASNGEAAKKGGLEQGIKKTGVKSLGVMFGMLSLPWIAGNAKKCDIVYERSSSFGAGTFAALLFRKPLAVEVVDNQRCGFLLRFADGIITHSDSLIPEYIDRGKILIMENAVDHAKFNPDLNGDDIKRKYDLKGKKVITYTGGFHPWHALDKIVIAAEKIIRRFPDAMFLMVGEGPESKKIMDVIKNHGMGKNFIFIGKVPNNEIPKFLAASDLLIALYTDKSYSHVGITTKLCEYMAMGKPIIAYGIKEELIRHTKNGMVIKSGENIEEKLEEYCLELLGDKKMRKKYGEMARSAVSQITWAGKAKTIDEYFRKLLG